MCVLETPTHPHVLESLHPAKTGDFSRRKCVDEVCPLLVPFLWMICGETEAERYRGRGEMKEE